MALAADVDASAMSVNTDGCKTILRLQQRVRDGLLNVIFEKIVCS